MLLFKQRKSDAGFTPTLSDDNKEAGFTLLEVLVAIFIITVGVGGAFALSQRTLASASILSNQLIASYLAQEGMELTRNIRDENLLELHKTGLGDWRDGIDIPSSLCVAGCMVDYNDSPLTLTPDSGPLDFLLHDGNAYSYDTGSNSIFTRKITVTSVNTNHITVTVEVAWVERGQSRNVTVEEDLYNWIAP